MPYVTDYAWNLVGKIIHSGWRAVSTMDQSDLEKYLIEYQTGDFDPCDLEKEGMLEALQEENRKLREEKQSLLNANAVMSYEITALRVGVCRLKEIQKMSFPPDPDSRISCQYALRGIEKLANAAIKEVDTLMEIPKQALKEAGEDVR